MSEELLSLSFGIRSDMDECPPIVVNDDSYGDGKGCLCLAIEPDDGTELTEIHLSPRMAKTLAEIIVVYLRFYPLTGE